MARQNPLIGGYSEPTSATVGLPSARPGYTGTCLWDDPPSPFSSGLPTGLAFPLDQFSGSRSHPKNSHFH